MSFVDQTHSQYASTPMQLNPRSGNCIWIRIPGAKLKEKKQAGQMKTTAAVQPSALATV
jgi:hypothetical protein